MATLEQIESFVSQSSIAIAGVSANKQKFGNAVLKELNKQEKYRLYPIHPLMEEVYGLTCCKKVADLPGDVSAIFISTKPDHTVALINDAKQHGIKHIWVQQGAENDEVLAMADDPDANIICKQCILMFAEPSAFIHRAHRWLKKKFGNYPQ